MDWLIETSLPSIETSSDWHSKKAKEETNNGCDMIKTTREGDISKEGGTEKMTRKVRRLNNAKQIWSDLLVAAMITARQQTTSPCAENTHHRGSITSALRFILLGLLCLRWFSNNLLAFGQIETNQTGGQPCSDTPPPRDHCRHLWIEFSPLWFMS